MPTIKNAEVPETVKVNPLAKVRAVFSRKTKVVGGVKKDRSLLWGRIGFGLGLAGIGFWLSPLLGLVICIPGIVFNLLGLRAEKGRWFAVAGLTLSIVFLNLAFVYGFYSVLVSILQGGV